MNVSLLPVNSQLEQRFNSGAAGAASFSHLRLACLLAKACHDLALAAAVPPAEPRQLVEPHLRLLLSSGRLALAAAPTSACGGEIAAALFANQLDLLFRNGAVLEDAPDHLQRLVQPAAFHAWLSAALQLAAWLREADTGGETGGQAVPMTPHVLSVACSSGIPLHAQACCVQAWCPSCQKPVKPCSRLMALVGRLCCAMWSCATNWQMCCCPPCRRWRRPSRSLLSAGLLAAAGTASSPWPYCLLIYCRSRWRAGVPGQALLPPRRLLVAAAQLAQRMPADDQPAEPGLAGADPNLAASVFSFMGLICDAASNADAFKQLTSEQHHRQLTELLHAVARLPALLRVCKRLLQPGGEPASAFGATNCTAFVLQFLSRSWCETAVPLALTLEAGIESVQAVTASDVQHWCEGAVAALRAAPVLAEVEALQRQYHALRLASHMDKLPTALGLVSRVAELAVCAGAITLHFAPSAHFALSAKLGHVSAEAANQPAVQEAIWKLHSAAARAVHFFPQQPLLREEAAGAWAQLATVLGDTMQAAYVLDEV